MPEATAAAPTPAWVPTDDPVFANGAVDVIAGVAVVLAERVGGVAQADTAWCCNLLRW